MKQKAGKVSLIYLLIPTSLSIIALLFTYDIYRGRQENLHVSVVNSLGDFEIDEMVFTEDMPMRLRTVWDVTISNISDSTMSLTWFQIKGVFGGGIFMPVKDMVDNSKEMNLPINLEPGHSKKLALKIGLPVVKEVASIVESYIESCESRSIWALQLYLAIRGIDLLGNTNIAYSENFTPGITEEEELDEICPQFGLLSLPPGEVSEKQFMLLIDFVTPRGNHFVGQAKWPPLPFP